MEKIQKSIKEWENLVREARERSTCCVCGRYQKNIGTKTVKMYNDVRESPTIPGRIEWLTRTISNVPVCASCSEKYTYEHARKFGPVKESLAEGWKLGDKPSQYEIDNASFF